MERSRRLPQTPEGPEAESAAVVIAPMPRKVAILFHLDKLHGPRAQSQTVCLPPLYIRPSETSLEMVGPNKQLGRRDSHRHFVRIATLNTT